MRLGMGTVKWVSMCVPPIRYCTDNAAMVGFVGIERLNGEKHDQSLQPSPSIWVSDFKEFSLYECSTN